MTRSIFTYHTDPGHGWLQVSQADLDNVGLTCIAFSSYSYTDGSFLFLEEDCDMTKFMEAYKEKHGHLPNIEEVCYDNSCFVRDLPPNSV